jgi:hypothetical protein
MGETMTWAATPEAKEKLAAGYKPPEKKWPCPKMQLAQEQAEAVMEEAAPGGDNAYKSKEKQR